MLVVRLLLLIVKLKTSWTPLRRNSMSPWIVPHIKARTGALGIGHVPALVLEGSTSQRCIGRYQLVHSTRRNALPRPFILAGTDLELELRYALTGCFS
jgi:hypothetical protein